MNIKIANDSIRNSGKDINLLLEEIKEIYEDIYMVIENMVIKDEHWLGYSAEEFILAAKKEKLDVLKFENELKEYADFLINYANIMDARIAEVRR